MYKLKLLTLYFQLFKRPRVIRVGGGAVGGRRLFSVVCFHLPIQPFVQWLQRSLQIFVRNGHILTQLVASTAAITNPSYFFLWRGRSDQTAVDVWFHSLNKSFSCLSTVCDVEAQLRMIKFQK